MKPVLVIGLGSALMGDDGIGVHVANLLLASPRLPEDVEVVAGGTDLLRYATRIEGRRHVYVIDAVEDAATPGLLLEIDPAQAMTGQNAHHLSACEAAQLLQLSTGADVTMLGITIASAVFGERLSPQLSARGQALADGVLERLLAA